MAIVFIGNSGAARECYWIWRQMRDHDPATPPFRGFLAWHEHPDNLRELAGLSLGNADAHTVAAEDQYVIAVGMPALRLEIYTWLKERNARFFTLKHPSVYLCPTASIGVANIFASACAVMANACIGDANFFNGAVTAGHDTVIGNANTCNLHTHFFGDVHVGDVNHFAPMTLVLEHSRIGSHNVFAPGAVVYRGCGDHCLMSGNPAIIERRLGAPHG